MRERGSVAIVILLLLVFISGVLLGRVILSVKFFQLNKISPLNNTQVTESLSECNGKQKETSNCLPTQIKPGEFFLKNYQGYKYSISWTGLTIEDNQPYFEEIYNFNYHAPLRLTKKIIEQKQTNAIVVKPLSAKDDSLIKYLDFPLRSGGPGGYFETISNLSGTNRMYFRQGFEGSDVGAWILMNIVTGDYINSSKWLIKEGAPYPCSRIPLKNQEQTVELYGCYSVNQPDSKSNLNELYLFDLITEKEQKLMELPRGQTFSCEESLVNYKYGYKDKNTLEIKICDLNYHVQDTKLIHF